MAEGTMVEGTMAQRAAAAALRFHGIGPVAELIHALNQPLTGLQCSLEVALAVERPVAEYQSVLRQGLDLTERMRALMEALREITEMLGESPSGGDPKGTAEEAAADEMVELVGVCREVVEDLRPVADANGVRMLASWPSAPGIAVKLRLSASEFTSLLFRLFDSTLSLAAPGSELAVSMTADYGRDGIRLSLEWRGQETCGDYTRPWLGMMVAQAGLQRSGARWVRSTAAGLESVTLMWPSAVPRLSAV